MLFPVLAFFGFFVTGLAARVVLIMLTAVWIWLAWSCYQRDVRGWRAAMGFSILFGMSSIITNLRHSADDIYRVMNLPKPPSTPLAAISASGSFRIGLAAVFLVAYLGLLLYTKRHFPSPSKQTNLRR